MSVSGKNTQELKGLLENYVEPFSISTDFLNQGYAMDEIEIILKDALDELILAGELKTVQKMLNTVRNTFSEHDKYQDMVNSLSAL